MRLAVCLVAIVLVATAHVTASSQLVTLDVRDADLADVLTLLAAQSSTSILLDESVKPQRVTLHLSNVTFEEALGSLTESRGLAEHRTGSVILIGTAEEMSRRFGARVASIRLSHADPAEVVKALEPALERGTVLMPDIAGGKIVISGSANAIARAREFITMLDSRRGGKEVYFYPLKYARPVEMSAALRASFPDAVFSTDDGQNTIVVAATPSAWQDISTFLQRLDVAGPQVLFEVRVVDIEPVNEQSDIGLQFGGYDLSGQPINGSATYTFARSALAINARLNALMSSGHARILATPKLLTLNNHEADILIGETYPVVYYDARIGGQQVQFVDVGVKLRMTPVIGSDGSITAEMHPEYSAIEGFAGGYPVIANRRVDSTLRIRDDQTIVLGGLLRDIDSETITKVPGLSAIPVFGKLFEDRLRTHRRDEVVFLITPHIVPAR